MTDLLRSQDLICPQCHMRSELPLRLRSAAGFCSACDFPLFYAPTTEPDRRPRALSERSARRRPGVGGRFYDGSIACPSCGEPNRSDAVVCHRDSVALVPAAPPAAPAPVVAPLPLPFVVLPAPDASPDSRVRATTEDRWVMLLLVLAVVPLLIALIVLL